MFKFVLIFLILISCKIFADEVGSNTGFKIPRFVTLKIDNANLRIGSSKNYPILLNYTAKNLPLEILEEFEDWRRIIDYGGNQGWIHESLLKGERFVIVDYNNQNYIKIFNKPEGKEIGKVGKKNILKIKICLKKWCKITKKNHITGWVNKKYLWGVYNDEVVNIPFYQAITNFFWKTIFN